MMTFTHLLSSDNGERTAEHSSITPGSNDLYENFDNDDAAWHSHGSIARQDQTHADLESQSCCPAASI